MMLVMGNDDYQAGKPPSPQPMAEIGKLAEKAVKAGKLVSSEGQDLRPRVEGGSAEYAHEFVDAHERCGIKGFEMQIRPMFGPEDFAGR
jgi:hypothetical protein